MEHFKNLKTDRSLFLKNYLTENYSKKSKIEILKELGLSWGYIQKMAHFLKIKREHNESKCDNKYKKLIDYNDPISCYWIGFLLADGHISKQNNIQINLSIKDKTHISKLESHLGHLKKYEDNTQIRVLISDKKTIGKLSSDFSWLSNKTKHPVEIPYYIKGDNLFSIIIGFIDGDGCISKKGLLYIKCDKEWAKFLEEAYKILTLNTKYFKLSSDGCSRIFITKLKEVINIKNKSIKLGLPIMNRKWDRVNSSRILKYDKYDIVKKLMIDGQTISQIKKQTGFGRSLIYKVKKDIDK